MSSPLVVTTADSGKQQKTKKPKKEKVDPRAFLPAWQAPMLAVNSNQPDEVDVLDWLLGRLDITIYPQLPCDSEQAEKGESAGFVGKKRPADEQPDTSSSPGDTKKSKTPSDVGKEKKIKEADPKSDDGGKGKKKKVADPPPPSPSKPKIGGLGAHVKRGISKNAVGESSSGSSSSGSSQKRPSPTQAQTLPSAPKRPKPSNG